MFQVDFFWVAMTSCLVTLLFLLTVTSSVTATVEPAGCKIRITDRGMEMCKSCKLAPC